jgi:hypothetical protein
MDGLAVATNRREASMRVLLWVMVLVVVPSLASAHHEAIFGPQSAMVLTSDAYLTAQMFTRQTGPQGDRAQETTTVLSAGFSPFKKPVSVAVIVPFSVISTGGAVRTGMEDAILGVRYRVDLPDLTRAINGRESFLMGVGGAELPTGTLDHKFGKDSVASIAAALMSIEKGQFSVIGYGFYRRQASYNRDQEGANLFTGVGLAWTPIDENRLLSLQMGLSRETHFQNTTDGVTDVNSGGTGVYAHPTVLYGFSQNVLLFGQVTLPVQQRFRDVAARERFRAGTGIVVKLGG